MAGIAHVDPKPDMAPLYYEVNRDLTIKIAKHAKECGVKQFVFMSSRIVYHASKSLKGDVTTRDTKPNPNDFYGDSKLQAEIGLNQLACNSFKVANLRPCMIYGPNSRVTSCDWDGLLQKHQYSPHGTINAPCCL